MQTDTYEKRQPVRRGVLSFLALSLCLGALLAFNSCQVPASGDSGGGSLAITISAGTSRTLVPAIDMTIASYVITGAGPGGSTFSQSTSSAAATVSGLVFGQWTVTVSGKDAAGTVVGQGSGSVQVDTGTQSTLSVTVAPLPGNGTISLTVSWTASNVQNPSLNAQLLPSTGSPIPLSFTLGTGSASCQNTSIPAGYYTLSIQFLDSGVLAMGAVEVARIVSGQTTTGTFDFTQANIVTGGITIGITPVASDPLTVTLTGQVATVALGSSMTVTASVAGNVGNVSYMWFVNGASQGTGSNASPSFTVGNTLPVGVYRLDVTAITADGSRAGSATYTFNVQ